MRKDVLDVIREKLFCLRVMLSNHTIPQSLWNRRSVLKYLIHIA